MKVVNVLIFVESRYKVNRKRIRAAVVAVLEDQRVQSPVEVSIAIVGDRKMSKLNKQYRSKIGTTNILSFPLAEGEPSRLPTDVVRLGDIVISYPVVIKESAAEEMLVDDRVDFLVNHGMLHLLGIHHQ
jgi:probable rRNA maturation factor